MKELRAASVFEIALLVVFLSVSTVHAQMDSDGDSVPDNADRLQPNATVGNSVSGSGRMWWARRVSDRIMPE